MFNRALLVLNLLNKKHRLPSISKCLYCQKLENKYTDVEKEKILKVINDSSVRELSRYDISKVRLKKINHWKITNGILKNISDVETVEGFTEKTAKKLCDSILTGPQEEIEITSKIKGQFLHPNLSESVRQKCKSVLTIYVAVNSVCWTLIDRSGYEVLDWRYHTIDYPDGKRLQITDILNISWSILQELPPADIFVMQAEATTLRAAGSDPNNPKVISVNLQKAQMVAMIVALVNARSHVAQDSESTENIVENKLIQKVYFLRPTLPYRLYGTLVGNERVSTEQTVEMLLQDIKGRSANNSHVYMSEALKSMFRTQKDLQKDMLGHCLLLSLTFMDLCIYKNKDKINKLLKKRSD